MFKTKQEMEIKKRKASALLKEKLSQKTLKNGKKNINHKFLAAFHKRSMGK